MYSPLQKRANAKSSLPAACDAPHASASALPSLSNSALLGLMGMDGDARPNAYSPNKTGLPDAMKARMEQLTGIPLDDVRVHRNSDKPAELGALAYAQGNEIHIGPGQEEHLEHELGHVVQQKQGVVKANCELCGNKINNDTTLEQAADRIVLDSEYANGDVRTQRLSEQSSTADVIQRELIVVGNSAEAQTELIGINAMPSFGHRTWQQTPQRLWGAGFQNVSNLCAGHSSIISGGLDPNAVLEQLVVNPALNPNVPAAQSGPTNSMQNIIAHGFGPQGLWNSLQIGLNRMSFGLLGSDTVPGNYHADQGVTGDPLARSLTTRVTPATRGIWDQLASQILNPGDTSGMYSFAPDMIQSDNCTTVALRRAITLCEEVIQRLGFNPVEVDIANIQHLQHELNVLIESVADQAQHGAQNGQNMQGRLMGALHRRY